MKDNNTERCQLITTKAFTYQWQERGGRNRKLVAAAASEPEANERGSSLICRRLHCRGLQSLFLTKRKELWLCANGRFRMRSGMPHGIVVSREWEDFGRAAYQGNV